VAEIDLGVPRWRDDPTHVFGVLANYLRLDDPERAPDVQFERAAAEAEAAAARIVQRARASGPPGQARALMLRFLFSRARALAGMRERPKFTVVRALGHCRKLLLSVGSALAAQGRLARAEDIVFLDLAEARRALAGQDYRATLAARREYYAREQRRKQVPRVLLSDGTAFYGGSESAVVASTGEPSNGLIGTPASPGVCTGRARVILEPAGASLEPGEILVAPSTDPGWTPLFLTAGALVMEMGGMMSHGAVVAREFGIPAIVGAVGATANIRTGQLVTVDGGQGIVTSADDVAQGSG
jgi:pyruvate,water dikinase